MRNKLLTAVVLLCPTCLAPTVVAELPDPVFWVPVNRFPSAPDPLFTHPNIIKMVHAYSNSKPSWKSGATVANDVCTKIRNYGLDAGEVAVFIEGYGNGDDPTLTANDYHSPILRWHPDDSLSVSALYEYWETPWLDNGINDASDGAEAWMDDFIDQYVANINADSANVHAPSRVYFNVETGLAPFFAGSVTMFYDLLSDYRGDREAITGFGANTLQDLYDDFLDDNPGSAPDSNYGWNDVVNRDWELWYSALVWQALDAGMKEAAYDPIKAQWANCLCANTDLSCRTDGLGDPARCFAKRTSYWGGAYSWHRLHWEGSADLQSPMLYQVDTCHQEAGETQVDATLRLARENLDACLKSFPAQGPHADEMAPWIPNIGWECQSYAFNKDDCRRMLALMRSKEVGEMVIYGAPSDPNDWNQWPSLIDQVWGADPNFVDVKLGTCSQSGLEDLVRYSDGETFDIDSAYNLDGDKTRFRADFNTDFDATPGGLRVHFEAYVVDAGCDATLTVNIRDFTNAEWDTIDTFTVDDNGDLLIDYVDVASGASDYIESGTDQVKVMFIFQTLGESQDFTSKVDLIQVVGLD